MNEQAKMSEDYEPTGGPRHVVRAVAYIFGNPWPICHACKRHVYLIEATGRWEHFA